MCGIFGFIGNRPAVPLVLAGLERLEYRGYDSAGVCMVADKLQVHKAEGRLGHLRSKLDGVEWSAGAALGHTRWATHGPATEANAHPHLDCTGKIAVVHNGIIENYYGLRHELRERGHRFRSETDTEVIAHLLEETYAGNIREALEVVAPRLEGSFAVAAACSDEPNVLVVVSHDSPLILGRSPVGMFFASDIPALPGEVKEVCPLQENRVLALTKNSIEDRHGHAEMEWQVLRAIGGNVDLGSFPDHMSREMHEQPDTIRQTLAGRISENGSVRLEQELPIPELLRARTIHFVGCGTAFHACLYGRDLFRRLTDKDCIADLASEYRYGALQPNADTLVIAVSQSGETADTLAAIDRAKQSDAKVLAVTNVEHSRLARSADAVFLTHAGPEIAVASTKAHIAQLLSMALLALEWGQRTGQRPEVNEMTQDLALLPDAIEGMLCALERPLQEEAAILAVQEHCFFLGRGMDWITAQEGQLKLKEISYIHAEALAAGELKHGSLALIQEGTPVVAIAAQPDLSAKVISNLQEVKARGARVLLLAAEPEPRWNDAADVVLPLPHLHAWLLPQVSVVALQMLAYHTAKERGCDVDKPRNLAKSVTVE